MERKLKSFKGAKILTKSAQKEVKGGMLFKVTDCPSGCFNLFIGENGGNRCAVPSPSGIACFGIVQNRQCCI